MRPSVHPRDLAALIFRVNVICVGRVWKHPETVAVVHILPTMVGDSARILRIAHPRTVVLQPAVNAIRIFVVNTNVVKLRDRKIFPFPPFASAVVGIPHPSVVSGKHRPWIRRIDPNVMHVAVHPRRETAAYYRETFTAVLT